MLAVEFSASVERPYLEELEIIKNRNNEKHKQKQVVLAKRFFSAPLMGFERLVLWRIGGRKGHEQRNLGS